MSRIPLSNNRRIDLLDPEPEDALAIANRDAAAVGTAHAQIQSIFNTQSRGGFVAALQVACSARDLLSRPITKAVLIGTGSFSGQSANFQGDVEESMNVAMYQYLIFESCVNHIATVQRIRPTCYAQDPAYNHIDKGFLQQHAVTVVDSPAGFSYVSEDTFIYVPGAEQQVETICLDKKPAILIATILEPQPMLSINRYGAEIYQEFIATYNQIAISNPPTTEPIVNRATAVQSLFHPRSSLGQSTQQQQGQASNTQGPGPAGPPQPPQPRGGPPPAPRTQPPPPGAPSTSAQNYGQFARPSQPPFTRGPAAGIPPTQQPSQPTTTLRGKRFTPDASRRFMA